MPLRSLWVLTSFALVLAIGSAPLHAGPSFADDAGSTAGRIVSIGGDVTEILYALGLGDRIVATDTTSTYPPSARDKPQVGYMRTLSAEGVLSLGPDLILATEDAGPPDVIAVLQRASVPFILIPAADDGAGATAKIRFIGARVGETAKAEELAAALEADLASVAAMRDPEAPRRKAVFLFGMSTGSPVAAGEDTAAEGIFALAGVDNALSGFSGYKPTSDEAMLAASPDAVVVLSEGNHRLSPQAVFSAPAFAATPAAERQALVAFPAGYLLNFGPRTAHAARDLAAAIYPERDFPALPPRPWTQTAGGH